MENNNAFNFKEYLGEKSSEEQSKRRFCEDGNCEVKTIKGRKYLIRKKEKSAS